MLGRVAGAVALTEAECLFLRVRFDGTSHHDRCWIAAG